MKLRIVSKTLSASLAGAALFGMVMAATSASAADSPKKPKATPYPLKTCVVSDEKLGGMGDPYVFVEKKQEVKLCCKSCLKDFKKDKAKFMKKIADAGKK